MPAKRPVKPSSRKIKAAGPAPEKEARGAGSRPSKPKRSAAKGKPAVVRSRVPEDLHSSLFRKNDAVMLIIDPRDGRIVDANRAAVRFYGCTARKLKTLRISDINVLDAGEVRLKMNQAIKKGPRSFIFHHRLADGTIRDVEVYSGPVAIKGRKLLYSIVYDITERKQAEDNLRASRDLLEVAQHAANAGVWGWDIQAGKLTWSEEFYRLFGLAPTAEASFDTWLGALHPEDREPAMARIDRVLRERMPLENEYRIIRPDGQVRWISALGNTVYDETDRPQCMYGICIDITERKRAEEALQFEREQLLSLFDSMDTFVYVTDPHTNEILYVNRALENMLGRNVVGGICHREFQGLEASCPFCTNEIILRQHPAPHHWEYHNPKVGRDFSIVDRIITWPDGREVRVEFATDITERKQFEEALRDSLETASAMLNAATESFALIDTEGTVQAANETFARRFGMPLDRIAGTSVYSYLNPSLAEHRRERFAEVTRSGQPLRFSDERSGRWLEHSLYPIFDSRGRVSRLVLYTQDITDRRRSEEALRQSEALLKSIFQAAPIGIGLVYNRVLGWTNDQVARMLGYSIEELAEKSARILYESDAEFERVGREKYIEVLQGGTGVIETQWKHKDGTLRDILLSSKAIDRADISAGVVFTALDITDRKRGEEALQHYQDELEQRVQERTSELMVANQALILEIEDRNRAEKALRDSERRLSDIIEFLPDATFVIDRDGKVIAWNKSMESMTGIAAKEMLGRGNYEYAVPFYGERRPLLIDLVFAAEEEIAGRYASFRRRDDVLSGESYILKPGDRNKEVYLSGTAAPLYDFQGDLVGAIESIRDVTERKRAEEDLRYRDTILEVASFAAERFLKAPSWETDIREILARLGTVTGVSRVYIFENRTSEEGVLLTSQRYEWVSDGIEAQIGNSALQNLAMEREGFARWAEIMRQGGHLYGLVREMPESERALLQSQDILSIAAMPVYLGDRWWGFMGYDDCLRERIWSDVEMEALSMVASTLSAAISRKHTEMRLVQTSERLSVVLESLPIVTFTAKGDEQGEISYITGTVEEITGFRPEAFLKDPGFLMDHVHPDDRPVVRGCHLGIGTKGMCGCEFRFRAANGTYRWFSEFCRLIHGPEGSIGRIVGMWQDVTEEKRILQESNTRLQQVIQAHKLASLGEIVAGVVHEINNPNSFITYNIPLLEEIWKLCEPVVAEYAADNPGWGKHGVSYEELRNDMAEIINAFRIGADRITRVIANLKDFARVEEGVQAKPVSVNDVVEKTLMMVGGQIRRSVSKLDLDLGGDLPQVPGQFQKLEQVMANLLVNAHQAIPDKEKGWIRISTRYVQRLDSVVVTIEDNGGGMTRPVIDRLFEPFFTTRRDTGGTGLGLSVSYGLIQEHQGVIGVLSRPDIGTRFSVFLPVRPGTQMNLRPLVLPLERDLDRLDELQMEVSGIDDGFVHWYYHYEPSANRLVEYLDQHPEVDIVLLTEPPFGLDPAVLLRTLREKFPLLTTVAWGGVEEDFTEAGGEKPDIYIKGPPDIRKLKGVIEGITRQRF
jgi:PAS domain S-box-containing protein